MSTARYGGSSSKSGGTSNSAHAAGGTTGTAYTGVTEEWSTTPSPTFQKLNLGQVYFNSTANAFKVTVQPASNGTWASGGNLNDARSQIAGVDMRYCLPTIQI